MPGPVRSVHQENVRPSVIVVVDKRDAGTQRLRQEFLPERPIVVDKLNSSLLRYISKCHTRRIRRRRRTGSREGHKKQNNHQARQRRQQLLHFATAFPSRPTPSASATRLM